MTRDDIIRMAREIELLDEQHYGSLWADRLVRFANLIAAAERDTMCRVLDEMHMWQSINNQEYPRNWHDTVDLCIAEIKEQSCDEDEAIRARGEK